MKSINIEDIKRQMMNNKQQCDRQTKNKIYSVYRQIIIHIFRKFDTRTPCYVRQSII